MGKWEDIPFSAKLLTNVDEAALRQDAAAIENAFVNETGGYTRFPGLKGFSTLAGAAPTFLHEWRGDLIAVSNSRMYRVRKDGSFDDVTNVPIRGSGRVIMDRSDEDMVIAAGEEIIRFTGDKTEILSPDAPRSTHVGYLDQYVVGVETDTGLFFNSGPGASRSWSALDVFAADSKPDNINSMIITPYRELMLMGLDSTEQFERLPSGNVTFFRRWSNGEGNLYPYAPVYADNAVWLINDQREFVRVSGQTSQAKDGPVGTTLEHLIDDFTGFWSTAMSVHGQKFILLQAPNATNVYGTKGITLAYDFRQDRWFHLYGWNTDGLPARWPGWSHYYMKEWNRHFVGGNGKIFELDINTFSNDGMLQRVLARTAHFDNFGPSRIDNVRMRFKRGLGDSNDARVPRIGLRARRDNKVWTNWAYKDLGRAGDGTMMAEFGSFGTADTWQFEWMVTDPVQVEVGRMQAMVTPLGW